MLKNFIRKLCREEKGLAVVLVAVAMTVLLGFTALVVDVGMMYFTKSRLSNACDAAALAGAREMPGERFEQSTEIVNAKNNAIIKATEYLNKNLDSYEWDYDFPSNKKFTVTASQEMEYTFAQIFGKESTTIKATATAIRELPRIADYALFSGSESTPLTITADTAVVDGDTHTNDQLSITGDDNTFYGILEYVEGEPDLTGVNIDYEDVIKTNVIPMPEYHQEIKAMCDETHIIDGSITVDSADDIDLSGGCLYVDGDIDIRTDDLSGASGVILATGNINIHGDDMSSSTLFDNDSLCFYSKGGNINLYGDYLDYRGIFYAPNGEIKLHGDDIDIEGSVFGNTISYKEGTTIDRDQELIDSIFWNFGLCKLVA